MMKRNIVILLFMAAACSGYAQKKDIQTARTYIKSKKDLDKAEQLMLNLLKDSANRDNEKIWLTLYEAQRAIYEQGNEKLAREYDKLWRYVKDYVYKPGKFSREDLDYFFDFTD